MILFFNQNIPPLDDDDESGVSGSNHIPCLIKPLVIINLLFVLGSFAHSVVNPNLNLHVQFESSNN